MDKNDKIVLYTVIFIGALIGTIAVLGSFLLFKLNDIIIDQTSINLLDMYIKASFTFFGSFFSILTSLFIFHLQNNKKIKDEKNRKRKILDFIMNKNKDNLEEIRKINRIFAKKGIEGFLLDFDEKEEDIKEIFLTIYTSIDTNSLDKIVIDLDPSITEEGILLKTFNSVKEVEKILMLIIEKAKTEIAKQNLLRRLNSLTEELK